MNTEKTKNSLTDIDSLTGDFPALTPARFFFSVFIVSLWFSHRFPLHRYG